MIYLDTSAAAKALIDEAGSEGVRRAFAEGAAFVSSRLLAGELHAVADRTAISTAAAQELLDREFAAAAAGQGVPVVELG